ncbi:MAG: hypothetical protein ACI8WB_004738 [Phenylobacterium sp.]|jgi:hypothetical protein
MDFLFKLLHALQTLATVPAIDWQAYGQILEPNQEQNSKDNDDG